uniref:Uncharacterized protein n=1 Tax=Arundo donax TaxID=35708 RepID=A0A0A8YHX5_ARUDO
MVRGATILSNCDNTCSCQYSTGTIVFRKSTSDCSPRRCAPYIINYNEVPLIFQEMSYCVDELLLIPSFVAATLSAAVLAEYISQYLLHVRFLGHRHKSSIFKLPFKLSVHFISKSSLPKTS